MEKRNVSKLNSKEGALVSCAFKRTNLLEFSKFTHMGPHKLPQISRGNLSLNKRA